MENYKENLETQLSELEMLQSAFPGEITLDDYTAFLDIQDYVNDKIKYLPSLLTFTVNLKDEVSADTSKDLKICLCVSLPHTYPQEKPDIFIRIDQNRTQQNNLNIDARKYLSTLESGDICIFSLINWLEENIQNYRENEEVKTEIIKEDECARYWIYSHHIYSKIKRKEIQNLANNYNLTGFCLPGKPGVICIEGFSKDCSDFWSYIKSMTWKKIGCKFIENSDDNNILNFRKFQNFEEIAFQTEGNRSNHMNMGEFNTYLEKHGSEYMFKELFGLEKS